MSTIKTSYGIALCRYNKEKNNIVEILLIKKRFSYQFISFVYGNYKKNDNKTLKYLFNNMSFAEKIDILGMQFSHMWYRIWLNNPERHFNIRDIYPIFSNADTERKTTAEIYKLYYQKKIKFEKNFSHDMGKRLRNLVNESCDAEIIWEIPKGGKKDSETNIDGAIREFSEETSIRDSKYTIFYNIPPIVEIFTDNNVTYKNVYYLATPKKDIELKPKINFKNLNQISEVEQIRWISLNEIKFMNLPAKYHRKLIRLYKNIINKFKKLHKKSPNLLILKN